MASQGRPPYWYLAANPDILEAIYRVARGRGVVVNYAKNQIESSFARPIFPSGRRDLCALLERLRRGSHGFPGLHVTHAGYERRPSSLGDEGRRNAFNFFLDIDGRSSLGPAQRVATSMARALEDLGVPHWVSFSGSSGFHVHIPSFAFPGRIDGEPFLGIAPGLFLDIKHFLIRKASEECFRDLLETVIHPKRYHGTTQGIQRLPYSLHEETGLLSVPVPDERLGSFVPELARMADLGTLDASLRVVMEPSGSVDGLLAALEIERRKPPPFYHRR